MKLSELAASCNWVFGLILDEDQINTQAVNATRQYLGYGTLVSLSPPAPAPPTPQYVLVDEVVGWYGGVYGGERVERQPCPQQPAPPATSPAPLGPDTDLTDSEWAVVKPLFLLYIERENARALEASRGLGVDPYGRSNDVVEADIRQYEADLPRLAFAQEAETI